ncbi:TPA: hypothetical protein P2339_002512 [Salmonella enterica subsp. enterica serovar Typhimurium]|nr:hypothetical protein [Salmonella enterica subsp. enterica serovar Typhimurium]HDO2704335.1 hypothetical protein [Salmonella enterica subsp. enterica serovar Typhimurium]HDO2929783.1 hypothetical protein [Salmonella enterica subsp. enterica serovar Typhimurium]
MYRKILLVLSLFITSQTRGYEIKRVEINSDSIGKTLHATIVLPDSYVSEETHFSTIYLLHGWSGNDKDWTENTDVATLSDKYQVIIVMPDGDYDKWYINSPFLPDSNYEKYIGIDIPVFVDKNFRTIASKTGRAITGFSMGGFGALNVVLNTPQTFGAVSSLSGGVDPRDYSKNWGLEKVFGDKFTNVKFWDDKAIINNAHQFVNLNIPLLIDCGVDDFFIEPNRRLHERLLELRISHSYMENPGGHAWSYWSNAIEYHFLFLKKALEKQQVNLEKEDS